jgi:hypothetical protein
MKTEKQCELCGKKFETYRKSKYCSMECYQVSRWGGGKCKQCGKPSTTRYCSDKCRNEFWNKNEYHLLKKKRYWNRKFEIIEKLGGKCSKCGNTDVRVLDLNHIDRRLKTRVKHYSWTKRLGQWENDKENLELLCANCHRINTWEQMNYCKF